MAQWAAEPGTNLNTSHLETHIVEGELNVMNCLLTYTGVLWHPRTASTCAPKKPLRNRK